MSKVMSPEHEDGLASHGSLDEAKDDFSRAKETNPDQHSVSMVPVAAARGPCDVGHPAAQNSFEPVAGFECAFSTTE
jgi:hypothetical protein